MADQINIYLLNGIYYALDHTTKQVFIDLSNGAGTNLQLTNGSYGDLGQKVIIAALLSYAQGLLTATPLTTITDVNSNSDTILTAALTTSGPQLITGIQTGSSSKGTLFINGQPTS